MKSMKPFFTLLLGILCLHRAAGREPVTIAFSYPMVHESEFVRAMAEVEGIHALESKVCGAIAVMAFSPGEPMEFPLPDGKILRGADFCSVRYGRIHPSKWHERFKLPNYVYFQIRFTDEPK